ncbi:MAG TPA: metallophosphoesterase [Rhodospirillaceae bacterium]|nr:metallophosphoesterase [Rhodospirillaceae bacterium]
MLQLRNLLGFVGSLSLLLLAQHTYIFLRLRHYLSLSGRGRWVLFSALALLYAVTLAGFPAMRSFSPEWAAPVMWVAFTWMGVSFLLSLALVAADLVWIFQRFISQLSAHRQILQRVLGVVVLGVTLLLSCYSVYNALRPVPVKPVVLTLERLPQGLDGLKIVQITDLHIAPVTEKGWLAGIVEQVNALNPDLIAITGDLVDGSVENLKAEVDALAKLKAPHGVYFVTGNHEYSSGVDPWVAYIASLGIRVLRNERVTITGAQGDTLDLAGVDDWGARRFSGEGADLSKALAGRDPDQPVILLAHQAAAVKEAAAQGVDLQISGHTHGGQIWPFSYLVYLQQPYVSGLHRYPDSATQVYISEGTGYWGPPMRLGTSAEITQITLKRP